ncbi:hypothetical protein G5V58_17860 [Nocardioides anomalus]|uniref:Aminoglycoside phosphotransferase domain-containing protein n=1 Tax=Nocardioides anomalus TaxID=2712223 RepID=A0A6G6WGN3_9ACTN|nr:hypothetical protein [Nocardioides anomalus]QIG44394.1 hypothetical protein G5V58_17860 [Nocardioides anomalus]
MRELAHLAGTEEKVLAESAFWARLSGGVQRLGDTRRGRRLADAAGAVERVHGGQVLELGTWHGDWGGWNMGMDGSVLQVWDWERSSTGVPIGFDAVHHSAQAVQPGRRDAARRERELLDQVPVTLLDLDVEPARHAATFATYLLEIATRYEDALTHGPLASLERRTDWILSLLEQHLTHPFQLSPGGRP